MAGTIVTDRIESDATYASKIELASPVLASNTFAVKSTGGTGVFNIVGANTNTDRTFTLPDVAGEVVTTASTGVVTESMLETLVIPVGVDQTWTDVKASRATDTTYTNSTGRPITIAVSTTIATYAYIQGFINDVQFVNSRARDTATSSNQAWVSYVVPPNDTYKVTINVNAQTTIDYVSYWFELR